MLTYLKILTTALITCMIISGCQTQKQVKKEKKESGGTIIPPDMNYAWQGFPQPAPTPDASKILIEELLPKKVRPNQLFTFVIKIRNNADFNVSDMVLTQKIPSSFVLVRANVMPQQKEDTLIWDLGEFSSGMKKEIRIQGKIKTPGAARFFGDTQLDFNLEKANTTVEIIHPELECTLEAPDAVIIGERIPVDLILRNGGKAPVIAARLVHTLPSGLLTYEGKTKIDETIGNLQPGERKVLHLDLKGEKTGNYHTVFNVVAEEGISAKAALRVKVTQPILKVTGKAPRKRYVGDIIPYTIDVKNVGDAVTKTVTVKMTIPEGTSLTSADEGGQAIGNFVVWNLPSLHPGENRKLSAKLVAKKIMTVRAVASTETLGAEKVEAVMITDVAGIPALLGSLIDTNDPCPLEDTIIYELTVTNQGSLPATKIKVTCDLEPAMEFIKSSGATKSILKGKTLIFDPLPALAAHSEAKWRIYIKAVKEGDVRFRVNIMSDQLTRPVVIEEASHFYE